MGALSLPLCNNCRVGPFTDHCTCDVWRESWSGWHPSEWKVKVVSAQAGCYLLMKDLVLLADEGPVTANVGIDW